MKKPRSLRTLEIEALLLQGEMTQKDIAAHFHISQARVSEIGSRLCLKNYRDDADFQKMIDVFTRRIRGHYNTVEELRAAVEIAAKRAKGTL